MRRLLQPLQSDRPSKRTRYNQQSAHQEVRWRNLAGADKENDAATLIRSSVTSSGGRPPLAELRNEHGGILSNMNNSESPVTSDMSAGGYSSAASPQDRSHCYPPFVRIGDTTACALPAFNDEAGNLRGVSGVPISNASCMSVAGTLRDAAINSIHGYRGDAVAPSFAMHEPTYFGAYSPGDRFIQSAPIADVSFGAYGPQWQCVSLGVPVGWGGNGTIYPSNFRDGKGVFQTRVVPCAMPQTHGGFTSMSLPATGPAIADFTHYEGYESLPQPRLVDGPVVADFTLHGQIGTLPQPHSANAWSTYRPGCTESTTPSRSPYFYEQDQHGVGSGYYTALLSTPTNLVQAEGPTPSFIARGLSTAVRAEPAEPIPVLLDDSQPSSNAYQIVAFYDNRESAVIAMRRRSSFVYVYDCNYGKRDTRKKVVYRCESHDGCKHRFRVGIHVPNSVDQLLFVLEQKGRHCGAPTERVHYGIDPVLKPEVDALATGGAGPKAVIKLLAMKYSTQPAMLGRLPNEAQVKTRKYFLLQDLEKEWKVETYVDLCEWCNPRMCETAEAFFGDVLRYREDDKDTFPQSSLEFQNEVLVLRCFRHTFVEDGNKKESFGIILTSRRLLRNVVYAVEGQAADGFFAAADGTYRLHYGNWTLVAFGTYRARYRRRKYSKNFVPWAYMFVRTEHEFAYEVLFRTVMEFAQKLFNITLTVQYGSLDHSASIANAFVAVWPSIVLLDCYAHVARKCRENSHRLRDRRFYEASIKVNIRQMHGARTPEQFTAISAMCLKYWRSQHEHEYADWFEMIYLDERWSRWYMTSAIPSILPSQNALESHNGVIKTAGIRLKKAKTGVVLNNSIPGVFSLVAQDTPKTTFGHFCTGSIPSKMVSRAHFHVVKGSYFKHKRTIKGKAHWSILFNSSKYMACKGNSSASPVTKSRVLKYIQGKQGKLAVGDTVLDITTSYQSLHEVELLNRNKELRVTLEPTISLETIAIIRSMYRCDCKAFWNTGWLCSHVIAAMDLEKQFTLSEAVAILPTTKASGGQRKVNGALYAPKQRSKTFTKPFLMEKLQENPLYVQGWQISQVFDVEIDGVKQPRQRIPGVIIGFCPGAAYKWRVDFSDDDVIYFECEDLVDLILESRSLGLDVTKTASAKALAEDEEDDEESDDSADEFDISNGSEGTEESGTDNEDGGGLNSNLSDADK